MSDETDLRQYLVLLWRRRFALAAITFVAGALAFGWAVLQPRMYEGAVPLTLSSSIVGGGPTSYGSMANFQRLLQSEALADNAISSANAMGGPGGSIVEFEQLLESDAFTQKLIAQAGLDPHRYQASSLFGPVLNVREISTSVLVLTARMSDPKMAARVANTAASLVVETADQLSKSAAERSRDALKSQLDEAQTRLESATKDLRNFKAHTQVDLLRQEADAALKERAALLPLRVDIETEKARLASAEQQLSAQPRTDTLVRSMASVPTFGETARAEIGGSGAGSHLRMDEQSLDPVYRDLDAEIAESRMTLAALEARNHQIANVQKLSGDHLDQVARLDDAEGQLSDLQTNVTVAQKLYEQVATAYQIAQLQVATRTTELQIMQPALAPDLPLSRHVVRETVIWAGAGLIGAALLFLLLDSVGEWSSNRVTPKQ